MISALHLLWIIPLSAFVGIFTASLAHVSADAELTSRSIDEIKDILDQGE